MSVSSNILRSEDRQPEKMLYQQSAAIIEKEIIFLCWVENDIQHFLLSTLSYLKSEDYIKYTIPHHKTK